MKTVTTNGKTIEEAILMAVAQLGVQRERLDIEIIEEPVKGLFGIIGGKDAKITATLKKTMADGAKDFLRELLLKMDVEGKVDVKEDEDCINVNISGPKMGILIGYRGETLDAVQYLTSLVVNKDKEKYKRVTVDTEQYRKKREETLRKLAKRLAQKVRKTRRKMVLEPMNPFERRIIHYELQNNPYVETHSEGEEPYRRIVISVK